MPLDKTLLIRIDERQKDMAKDIASIKNKLDCKVDKDTNYEARGKKIDTLWDDRNKMIGWLIGSGIIGGSVSVLGQNLIKLVSAAF